MWLALTEWYYQTLRGCAGVIVLSASVSVKRNDIFDDQMMTMIKQDLVSLAEQTRLDLTGCVMHTTFHGSVSITFVCCRQFCFVLK